MSFTVDVTKAREIFEGLQTFEAGRTNAALVDGRFVAWTYVNGADRAGVLRPIALGGVRVGATPEEVGIRGQGARDLSRSPEIPAGVPCEPLAVQRLRIPAPPFEYVASCRDAGGKGSRIVLFDTGGRHELLGSSEINVVKLSTAAGVHGSEGILEVIAGPDEQGRVVLQRYTWAR